MTWAVEVEGIGTFTPASWESLDGETNDLGYAEATLELNEHVFTVMAHAASPQELTALAPRLRQVFANIDSYATAGITMIVTEGSELTQARAVEVAEAQQDLCAETLELHEDGTFGIHFVDTCGLHFSEGYWPQAHFDVAGNCTEFTVEA